MFTKQSVVIDTAKIQIGDILYCNGAYCVVKTVDIHKLVLVNIKNLNQEIVLDAEKLHKNPELLTPCHISFKTQGKAKAPKSYETTQSEKPRFEIPVNKKEDSPKKKKDDRFNIALYDKDAFDYMLEYIRNSDLPIEEILKQYISEHNK